ncbi:hypothetical protein O1L60_03935 [Streptomyces diastatochromogenes]|nr:hypothetical protein [Streptomyces diastatochromogenes]
MTRYRLDDPQPPVPERLRARLEARLAERGIDPAAMLPDTPEPIPALEAAQLRIPYSYREALVEHPDVAAWVRKVSDGAVAPSTGGLNPSTAPPGAGGSCTVRRCCSGGTLGPARRTRRTLRSGP